MSWQRNLTLCLCTQAADTLIPSDEQINSVIAKGQTKTTWSAKAITKNGRVSHFNGQKIRKKIDDNI